jgi:hypothetical protein
VIVYFATGSGCRWLTQNATLSGQSLQICFATVRIGLLVFEEIMGQRHSIRHHLKVAADRRPSSFGAIKSTMF